MEKETKSYAFSIIFNDSYRSHPPVDPVLRAGEQKLHVSIPGNSIGEMTAINETEFLVIERDNNQGVNAAFKRIFRVNLEDLGEDGHTLNKTLVADLLSIYDRDGLTTPEEGAVGLLLATYEVG